MVQQCLTLALIGCLHAASAVRLLTDGPVWTREARLPSAEELWIDDTVQDSASTNSSPGAMLLSSSGPAAAWSAAVNASNRLPLRMDALRRSVSERWEEPAQPRRETTELPVNLTSARGISNFDGRAPPPLFSQHNPRPRDGDEGLNFFRSAPLADWLILSGVCAILCLLDLIVMGRLPDALRWHGVAVFSWVASAAAFNCMVWARMGGEKALEWTTGYLIEWMLSIDNLLVFHLVFSVYKTPPAQVRKAVFVGIIGAVLMRMGLFMAISTLLGSFGWFRWPFGCLLVWSGIEAARSDDDDNADVTDTLLVRGLTWCLGDRLLAGYDEGSRIVCTGEKGQLQVTMLFIVISCVEIADFVFALDSVSAKVAQIPQQYIAFSSSVLAMFGLRATFFVVKDLVVMFALLKYGLCLILVFIGIELMFAKHIHLASSTVWILITAVFVVCVMASWVKKEVKTEPSLSDQPAILKAKPRSAL